MSSTGGQPQQHQSQQEKALAQVTAKQWNHYQKHGVPFENQYLARLKSQGNGEHRAFAVGQAAKTAEMSAPNAAPGQAGATGNFLGRLETRGHAVGVAGAYGGTRADAGVSATKTAGLESAVKLGEGQQSTTSSEMTHQAQQGASEQATKTSVDQMNNAADMNAIGTAAGLAGYGAYDWYHNRKKSPIAAAGAGDNKGLSI